MTTTLQPAAAAPPVPHRPAARALGTTVALCILAVVAFLVSMAVGQFPVSPAGVVRALLGGGDEGTRYIVTEVRLPRAATGVVVGALLATAGALTQSFTRNPLASPDLLGVTGGASAAAVAAIVVGGGTYGLAAGYATVAIPIAAAVGGLVTALLIFGLAWRGDLAPDRFVLVGIGASFMTTAAVSWLLVSASISEAGSAAVWLTGSLNSRSFDQFVPLVISAAILLPAAAFLRRPLAAMALGDDVARGLGTRLRTVQLTVAALSALLASAAVAAAGPVPFVALVAPQIALRLTGRADIPLLASAATGAALVTVADLIGRTVTDFEIPVGLITAAIGAPYLIRLLVRRRKA
ncbi:FecCD family ABC transporter permease [Jatrophihabitans sp. YIM 134969]